MFATLKHHLIREWRLILTISFASFFMNFFWEMWQMPFFEFLGKSDYWKVNWICTKASLGDAIISLSSYFIAGWVSNDVTWYRTPKLKSLLVYFLVGIGITIVLEWINTVVLHNWEYHVTMPILPLIGTGIIPMFQWLVVPLLILLFLILLKINNYNKDE